MTMSHDEYVQIAGSGKGTVVMTVQETDYSLKIRNMSDGFEYWISRKDLAKYYMKKGDYESKRAKGESVEWKQGKEEGN